MSGLASLTAVIIDDHPLARIAIRGVLETHSICVMDEYDDGLVALLGLLDNTIDIVVLDVEIPNLNGIELVEKLRNQNFTGILIVVSAKNDRYYSKRCAQAGANAFISKKQNLENIISAVNAGINGYTYYPYFLPEAAESLTDTQKLELLSPQEMKVLGYVLKGLDNSSIGEKMHISSKTVSTYKTRLMDKLACKSLIELLSFAHQNKLT